jgi:protein SCO1
MRPQGKRFAAAWVLWLAASSATAQHVHNPEPASAPVATLGPATFEIPDVVLQDQDGKPVHIKSDLLKNRLAAVSFIFTTCTTVCPPIGANFARLEQLLAGRAGKDILLLSVSVDSQTDTPEKLLAWRKKFGGGAAWTLLTGNKRDVDAVLNAFGAFSADKQLHTSTMAIGSADTGEWTRLSALTPPARVAEMMRNLPVPALKQKERSQ